jgi:hypothetical protein
MTKREAKREAYETVYSLLIGMRGTTDTFEYYSQNDQDKIYSALETIAMEMKNRADKLK